MRSLFLLFLLLHVVYGFDVDIYNKTISNGRTTVLEFKKIDKIKYDKISFGKKIFKIYKHPSDKNKLYSMIPVSYYATPKKRTIEIFYTKDGETKSKKILLHVVDGNYKKEKIKVQNSKVNPTDDKVKRRIAKEYSQAMRIYATITPKLYISSKFIAPMESKITSEFGKARVYNDTLKGYHSGTDYRAKIGTPIKASNDGVVVLVKKRFYSGGTVILDHGHAIYTCYYHMSKFNVIDGQSVKKGDIIGLSGNSGRVTGPHLHFSARVSGEQVDPLQFISLVNKKLF